MNMKRTLVPVLLLLAARVHAADVRDRAIKNSPMVLAIIEGLRKEQNLKCRLAIEESGKESIAYYVEDGRSKFSIGFLCNDGRTAVITGVIGDGSQTETETFKLVYAP